MYRSKLLVTFLAAAIFFLAACASAPAEPPAEAGAPAVPSPSAEISIATEPAVVTAAADEPAPATVAATSEAASEPAPTDKEVREVRAELAASDPGAFQIASGEVQLVEFFAFW